MSTPPTCVFFKRCQKKNIRNKKGFLFVLTFQDSSSSEEDVSIVKKQKKSGSNPLVQEVMSDLAYFYRLKTSVEQIESKIHLFMINLKRYWNQGATRIIQIDEETKKAAPKNENVDSFSFIPPKKSTSDKVYKGLSGYASFVASKRDERGSGSSGYSAKGPIRAPQNIRSTDYKETGFCSFGDSCIFLHDRSDYKHGWQIDREIDEGTFGIDGSDNRYEVYDGGSDYEEEEHIPFKCKHYFCSACAIKRYQKTARCYACTEDTRGFFKNAKDLIDKIRKLKKRLKSSGSSDDENNSDAAHSEHECCEDDTKIENSSDKCSCLEACNESDSSDANDVVQSQKLLGAKPEAPEFCNTDEESSD
ncbi:unnamed protein product [Protopolystoma xenopodis]|uniref:C3H1-type domain-containing protein n=1 Tax=Protopolystoma xenopodis TaxID=117903 RepID=A0A448WYD6_9PLAT|nr:unnamed protein product [Protopolystoma xenopodis]